MSTFCFVGIVVLVNHAIQNLDQSKEISDTPDLSKDDYCQGTLYSFFIASLVVGFYATSLETVVADVYNGDI